MLPPFRRAHVTRSPALDKSNKASTFALEVGTFEQPEPHQGITEAASMAVGSIKAEEELRPID